MRDASPKLEEDRSATLPIVRPFFISLYLETGFQNLFLVRPRFFIFKAWSLLLSSALATRLLPLLNMLDLLDFITERGGDPKKVRESQRRRHADEGAVDEVIALYEHARKSNPSFQQCFNRQKC